MSINQKTIKNILVVRNDRFGEFLLNIPAFRALKETFINARIILIVDPYVRELAESIYFIDEIIEWKRQKHPLWEKLRLLQALKRRNIDMAIMSNPSKEFNIFTFLAGIPIRLGYDRKWGFLLTHKIKDNKYLGNKHEVEYNLELVNLIGADTKDRSLALKIDDDLSQEILAKLNLGYSDDLIAIHPWTSDSVKQWPIINFSELARRLIKELDIKVVIVGGQEELTKSKEFFDNMDGNLINITSRTTLMQLAAFLKKCKLLISCDSGPVHLACAVGTTVVAIFRSDIPAKSSKRWGPWGEGHTVIEKNNLKDITVDEVFIKVKEKLRI